MHLIGGEGCNTKSAPFLNGDGAVAVPDNPLGSPAKELTDDELKGLSGGGKDATEQSVNNWIDERIHFLDPSA